MIRCSAVATSAETVTVRTDSGVRIGTVTGMQPYGSPSRLFVTQAHDWDGDYPDPNKRYDPITIGVFDDPEQALSEIETRAESYVAAEHGDQPAPAIGKGQEQENVLSGESWVWVGDRRYSVHAVAYDLNDQPANDGQLYADFDMMSQAREWAHRLFRRTGPFTMRDPQISKVVAHGREMVFTGRSWSRAPSGATTVKGAVETITRDIPVELNPSAG